MRKRYSIHSPHAGVGVYAFLHPHNTLTVKVGNPSSGPRSSRPSLCRFHLILPFIISYPDFEEEEEKTEKLEKVVDMKIRRWTMSDRDLRIMVCRFGAQFIGLLTYTVHTIRVVNSNESSSRFAHSRGLGFRYLFDSTLFFDCTSDNSDSTVIEQVPKICVKIFALT